MRNKITLAGFLCVTALALLVPLRAGFADDAPDQRPAAQPAEAITRGLAFLQKDAAQWKVEKQCASCHHGAMTLWAFTEAKRQGYPVDAAAIADTMTWAKGRFMVGLDKPRDPRPGWNMISTPALFLAMMDENQPGSAALTAEERTAIAGHAARHLEEDGSVLTPATMTPPLPQNGPPPVFESREVLTLFALLAMRPKATVDGKETPEVRAGREKAEAWLRSATPGDDTQAAALRLLLAVREGQPRKTVRAAIDGLLKRQNADGGWGQLRTLGSDAFATGQTIYALAVAGVDPHRQEVKRATAFLAANQKPDGSWPMTSRAQPGATPFKNPAPITHIGSAWAVIGLVRAVPAGAVTRR